MTATKTRDHRVEGFAARDSDWRKDLAEFRGLSDPERAAYLVILEWFEGFRMRFGLAANREAAERFWRLDVKREGVARQDGQLRQWAAAIQWSRKRLRLTRSVQKGGGG